MYQTTHKSNPLTIDDSQIQSLIRIKSVTELTGLSKSYIYALADKGLFPKSVQLVPGGTSVGWVKSEVLDWIDSRIQSRDAEYTANINQ